MKKYYYILLLAVISMTTVSCDEWVCEWDTPPSLNLDSTPDVLGRWESYCEYDGDYEYDIQGFDMEWFEFYSDYTGRFYFYSGTVFSYVDFRWNIKGGRLMIWEDDYYYEMYYSFNYYGDLMLSSSGNFYNCIVYCPADYYYEQGKSIDPSQAKKFDSATDEMPKSAMMRAMDE